MSKSTLAPTPALSSSASEYNLLLANIKELVVLIDKNYIYEQANEKFLKYHNFSKNEILGLRVPDVMGDEVFKIEVKPALDRALRGEIVEKESFFKNPRFGEKYVKGKYLPVCGEDGIPEKVMVILEDLTEKKKVESEFKNNELLLDSMLDSVQSGIVRLDKDLTVLNHNKKMREWVGRDFVGEKCHAVIRGSDKPCEDCHSLMAIKNRKIFSKISAPNEIKYEGACFHVSSYPVFNDQKEVIGAIKSIQDITEKVAVEALLKRNEARYRALYDKSPDIIFLIDLETQTVHSANPAACHTMQYLHEDLLVGRHQIDLHPKRLAKEAENCFNDLKSQINNGKSGNVETVLLCADGSEILVEVVAQRVHLEEKDLMLCACHDLRERRKAEQALRESESKYRTIFDGASEGIVLVDIATRRIVNANAAMVSMLGYSQSELKNLYVEDLHTPEDLPNALKLFQKAGTGELDTALSVPMLKKDSSVIYVDLKGSSLNINGEQYVAGFVRDVTTEKRLNDELMKLQKFESLGLLAGGIAHDFNNLLTVLSGCFSLIKLRIGQNDDIAEIIYDAEIGVKNAKNLTGQLLFFSNAGILDKKVFFVKPLLLEASRFALRGSNLKPIFQIEGDVQNIEVDESQFSQVVNNLLINAKQAMPDGGRIEVSAGNRILNSGNPYSLSAGKYVEIKIRDFGVGISVSDRKKIFDPYFTTKATGTGLGLTICYSIIKKHGGMISMDSRLGTGTTFSIFLPASKNESDHNPKMKDRSDFKLNAKILLMDDNESIRKIAASMLESTGCEVSCAEDGMEALKKYDEALRLDAPFDVAIMDLTVKDGMGGMDGSRKILTVDPNAKIIVSSGYSNDKTLLDFHKHGFKNAIRKPYSIEDLHGKISKTMETRKSK